MFLSYHYKNKKIKEIKIYINQNPKYILIWYKHKIGVLKKCIKKYWN